MASVITFKVTGDKEAKRFLRNLTSSAQKALIRPAITASLRPMKAAVKTRAGAIKDSGAMAKSIGSRVKTYKSSVVGVVGPKSKFTLQVKGEKKPRKPSKYLHLLEYGTKRSAPQPFMRQAFRATVGITERVFRMKLKERILNFVRKKRAK